jgi:exopolysaccharide biosynthesis polyprenyl glycosylphosphotransferase
LLIWDLILTLFCLHATTYIRYTINLGKDIPWHGVQLPWPLYIVVGVIWLAVFLLLIPQRAIFRASLIEAIGRLLGSVSLASLVFAGVLYLSFRNVSRLQFLYFVVGHLVLLLIMHLIVRSYMHSRHQSGHRRRVLVVGDTTTGQQLAHEFARRPWAGLEVVGYATDEAATTPHAASMPCLGAVDETPCIVKQQRIDEVIVALPTQQYERVTHLSLQLQQQPVMVHMVPSVLDLTFARTPVSALGGIPLISLRESALSETQRLFKRMCDIVGSLVLLLLLSPLMFLIALLIKLESPGSVFFKQERVGENGEHFKMIKFRSMYQDAEQRWREVAQRDPNGRLLHKHGNDPRITRIGRTLRRTSMDELPQLINVLRGEMSLVGPRPEMPYITDEYEPWQWQRFRVPAGITGWWQVNGRSDKPMHLHTEDDLYYIQNYSFWLDLRILLKTVLVVLRGQGAY